MSATTFDPPRLAASAPTHVALGIWAKDDTLIRAHYAIFVSLYVFYGYQVCPFLAELSFGALLAPVLCVLGVQLLVRDLLRRRLAARPLERVVIPLFWIDIALFALGGGAVAVFNFATFGFPPDSGVKVILAFLIVGLYSGLDSAFQRDMQLAKQLRQEGKSFPLDLRFMPYQKKFVTFSMLNIVIVAFVITLVILKDLMWVEKAVVDMKRAQLIIMAEVLFILTVLGAYIFRVILQYSRKHNFSLEEETQALRRVHAGNLETRVTVASNDEFGHMAALTNHMIERLQRSVDELERTRDVTISALVSLSSQRDSETGLHLQRTQTFAAMIAEAMRQRPPYGSQITSDFVDLMYRCAPLHDIGKVGVPDAILRKPGKLDATEFDVMKTHAQIGASALEQAEREAGGSVFLAMAREIALSHHERWDGGGYPNGLAGEDIPLSGRIMAVADVYDALRMKRVYKPSFSHEKAMAIILEGRGAQFDPDVVDAFVSIEPEIRRISAELAEQDETASAAVDAA